jgi:putative oxidoreductase
MTTSPVWANAATTIARVIFAGVFAMSATMKFTNIEMTAGAIQMIGLPFPVFLAALAAVCEAALVVAFLTGAFFTEAALAAAAYVLFLAFAFHGPSAWGGNQMEFGFFVDHFSFLAGLLLAAVHGPGAFALKLRLIGRGDWANAAHA